MSSCPPLHILGRLGSGEPGGSTDLALDAHVNHCRSCQGILDALVARDLSAGEGVPLDPNKLPRIPGFAMEGELGRGGMGVVYLARELNPDRQVAVKFLSNGPFTAPRDRDRWLKEARAAARVRHPHIIQLYQVGEAEGWLYLVLEYLAGGSLKQRLTGPVSPRVAASLLVPVARALERLHLAGVWHLDLKPANILIDALPETPLDRVVLKLSDFGIARLRDDADSTGSVVGAVRGTLPYMAPEQLDGRRSSVGPATDTYAMGVILYEMLTGRLPFQADGAAETIRRVQFEDPVPPRKLNRAIPHDLETICQKCLEKDAGRRYASAGALAEDLSLFLDGHPIAARAVSKSERLSRRIRRQPVVAALGGCLALALAVGVVVAVLLWRFAEAERENALADFGTAREVLSQVVEWSTTNPMLPAGFDQVTLVRVLEQTRHRLAGIVARRPDSLDITRHLATVDTCLGFLLTQGQRWDDARSVLDESVAHWERLSRLAPLDREGRYNHIRALRVRADLAQHEQLNDVEIYLRRALAASEELARVWRDGGSLHLLGEARLRLATYLVRRGAGEQAQALITANRTLFDNATADDLGHPDVVSWRVLVHMDFELCGPPSPSVPLPGPSVLQPRGSDPLRDLADAQGHFQPAPKWAELAFRALQSSGRPDAPARFQAETGWYLIRHLGHLVLPEQRRLERLDSAGVTADRMLALGELLVERFPDRPSSHLALSEAYIQLNKNAWRHDDREAIIKYLRLSLASARHALSLDPTNTEARYRIDLQQRKLDDLLAPPVKRQDSR